jgi:hypothetical protein
MSIHVPALTALCVALGLAGPQGSGTGQGGAPVASAQDAPPAPDAAATPLAPDFVYPEVMATAVAATGRGDWTGAAGELRRLVEADEHLSELQRAEVHFAVGLVQAYRESERAAPASEGGLLQAAGAFDSARALAGPGRLRLDATYDLAGSVLLHAERWRSEIPEVAQAAGTPPPPPPPPPPAGATGTEEGPPDPLVEARAAYLEARARLIERLRADWRDADTRANLELVQRRLAELDELERQREEQQEEGSGEDQSEGEEGDEGEEDSDEPSDSEGEEEPSEEESEGDQGDEDAPEDDPQNQPQPEDEPPAPETTEAPRPEEGEARSGKEQPAERLLTREEVMRLLDKLSELEQEGEALRAAMSRARRIPVERDW